jgi:hypothetical protein
MVCGHPARSKLKAPTFQGKPMACRSYIRSLAVRVSFFLDKALASFSKGHPRTMASSSRLFSLLIQVRSLARSM